MLRGISDLRRFTIAATDGDLGSVADVYFDDRSWNVRYLVVDAGDWLPGRRVLVSPIAVQSSDPTTLRVALTKQQLGSEPATPARAVESDDVHLQTATAVMGYAVEAEDGEIGHVKDVLVDDRAWAIRYLGRRRRESVGGQEGTGVAGVAHPRGVGRVEDALLHRHGDRRRYRDGRGFEGARASSRLIGGSPAAMRTSPTVSAFLQHVPIRPTVHAGPAAVHA